MTGGRLVGFRGDGHVEANILGRVRALTHCRPCATARNPRGAAIDRLGARASPCYGWSLVPSHLSRSRFRRWIGRTVLRTFGWTLRGEAPAHAKCVLIAAPHTSNWDGFFMLAVSFALGVRLSWMVKHTLFRGPFGPVLRWLGGVAIDRTARHDVVEQMAAKFGDAESLVLSIAPEGMRRKTLYWKTGFYHIAVRAKVPIYFSYLDFGKKLTGVGPCLVPTGNLEADAKVIRAFYEGMNGKHPSQFTNIEIDPRARAE